MVVTFFRHQVFCWWFGSERKFHFFVLSDSSLVLSRGPSSEPFHDRGISSTSWQKNVCFGISALPQPRIYHRRNFVMIHIHVAKYIIHIAKHIYILLHVLLGHAIQKKSRVALLTLAKIQNWFVGRVWG